MIKKKILRDPNIKGSMSETFDKSQMSETIDVPAGCTVQTATQSLIFNKPYEFLNTSNFTLTKIHTYIKIKVISLY